MMATCWIADIMLVMSLMPTQDFGGNVMMTMSLKLDIFQKKIILERLTKKSDVRLNRFIVCCLYQKNPSEKIQLYYFKEFTTMYKINQM